MVISNGALFYFVYTQESKTQVFTFFVSFVAIFLTWILFFIDRRNKSIFERANKVSSEIESYFYDGKYDEMRLHKDEKLHGIKKALSHSGIFLILTIAFTVLWIVFFSYMKYLR